MLLFPLDAVGRRLPGRRLLGAVGAIQVHVGLLLDLLEVQDGGGGVGAVDDLGELLEGGAAGLDVLPEDEGELESDPELFVSLLSAGDFFSS